ncbi:hypothetical protein GCM10009851_35120 [Herbiconiux moechotypicola]|uniref:MmyB-like transcription regulator ligand binding domain-containing protein n=2 Tax=Herbiconiux moechotypicola TaxID=637393 RepID=A0ABP5R031_9MICO
MNVVESNQLAREVAAGFSAGSNLVRTAFFSAAAHASPEDLAIGRAQLVALLRESLLRNAEDGTYLDLIGELVARSTSFSTEWAKEPSPSMSGRLEFNHPAVGVYSLVFHLFTIGGSADDTLVIWSPADDSGRVALESLGRLNSHLDSN